MDSGLNGIRKYLNAYVGLWHGELCNVSVPSKGGDKDNGGA